MKWINVGSKLEVMFLAISVVLAQMRIPPYPQILGAGTVLYHTERSGVYKSHGQEMVPVKRNLRSHREAIEDE